MGDTVGGRTVQLCGLRYGTSSTDITNLVENLTGKGTVYALKIREPKKVRPGSRLFAVIQFTSSRYAEVLMHAHRNGMFGRQYTVRYAERDIITKPKVFMFTLENAVLYFGCQTSEEEFAFLWNVSNVTVNFGFSLQKLEFFLSHKEMDYRLDLFYSYIWQIQLRRPRGQYKKFVLIQVQCAPRIYKKNLCEDPLKNYFLDIPDEQWIRATDFTPSHSIGQSSMLCLEVLRECRLPDMGKNFVYYKESETSFRVVRKLPYSTSSELVPIVNPTIYQLPYKILFKVNSLIQNGILMGPALDSEFYRLLDPLLYPMVEYALESMFQLKYSCFKPAKYIQEKYNHFSKSRQPPKPPAIVLESGLVYVHRVQITPSKVYFCGPEVNVSNRVLRHYHEDIDNFLRVSFIDEEYEKIRSMDLLSKNASMGNERYTDIYRRICSALRTGIVIGNKKFEFLAFSSSQLRENSAWMFASKPGLRAADIRRWMGDFREIRNVAKYAARLGQSFSSSKETLNVPSHEFEIINDIELWVRGRNYNFSDGIGKISASFSTKVARKCDLHTTPSAFQIRYGGFKGVVAVDPQSKFKLSLRKSMCKYKSDNTKLDVLSWSKYQPCFLNRQFITLLSTLGIRDSVFQMKQVEAIKQLDAVLVDPFRAQDALELMSPGENTRILKEMLMCGYKPDSEPFLSMMLQTFRASKLLELKTKSRIFIPEGRSVMGCLDETRTLNYGQVFIQTSCARPRDFYNGSIFIPFDTTESSQSTSVIEGKVVVAKNPCLHPGDIRVLMAVNVPALSHMVDCVVFPQKGKRPHPNECSGSDLDGDIYFVSWDPELIPPHQIEPMDYDPAPAHLLDHEVTIEEVEEYFANYMVNDSLGVIANAHTVFADKEPEKAESDACIELARLFSIAVDFPKTGVPAMIPPNLLVKDYPDFMEKRDKPTYESRRVIGKLFRAVKDISSNIEPFTFDKAVKSYDHDMEVDGFEDYLMDAEYYKGEYDFKLVNLMEYYGIMTEAEIISGSILKLSKSFTKNKDAVAIGFAVKSLKKEARRWFDEMHCESNNIHEDGVHAKASAWYHVTYHPHYFGQYNEGLNKPHFLSFPWVVYDKLIAIKQKKMSSRRAGRLESLQRELQLNLRIS